jgi:hypothetical protein
VTQWCIEEAVMERAHLVDRPGPSMVATTEYGEPADPALAATLDQAREWHEENR